MSVTPRSVDGVRISGGRTNDDLREAIKQAALKFASLCNTDSSSSAPIADSDLTFEFNTSSATVCSPALTSLRHLTHLSLVGNQFCELPDNMGALLFLRTLNVSHNRLQRLPDSICALSELVELRVNKNELRALPEALGKLRRLKTLDASHNELIALPLSLHACEQLADVNVQHNESMVMPPLSVRSRGTVALLAFLKNTDSSMVTPHRHRLVLLGEPKVGRTAFGRMLRRSHVGGDGEYVSYVPRPGSTMSLNGSSGTGVVANDSLTPSSSVRAPASHNLSGDAGAQANGAIVAAAAAIAMSATPSESGRIDIREWRLKRAGDSFETQFFIWEFGGAYYKALHTVFLSLPSIYIVLFDLRSPDVGSVEKWLESIAVNGDGEGNTIIVGTHADECPEQCEAILNEMYAQLRPSIDALRNVIVHNIMYVSNTLEDADLKHLFAALLNAEMGLSQRKVPHAFYAIEECLGDERRRRRPPLLSIAALRALAAYCGIHTELQVQSCKRFLGISGSIFDVPQAAKPLGIVALTPSWAWSLALRGFLACVSYCEENDTVSMRSGAWVDVVSRMQRYGGGEGVYIVKEVVLALLECTGLVIPMLSAARADEEPTDNEKAAVAAAGGVESELRVASPVAAHGGAAVMRRIFLVPPLLREQEVNTRAALWTEANAQLPFDGKRFVTFRRHFTLPVAGANLFAQVMSLSSRVFRVARCWRNACVLLAHDSERQRALARVIDDGRTLEIDIRVYVTEASGGGTRMPGDELDPMMAARKRSRELVLTGTEAPRARGDAGGDVRIVCKQCNRVVSDEEFAVMDGRHFHLQCLHCAHCNRALPRNVVIDSLGRHFCKRTCAEMHVLDAVVKATDDGDGADRFESDAAPDQGDAKSDAPVEDEQASKRSAAVAKNVSPLSPKLPSSLTGNVGAGAAGSPSVSPLSLNLPRDDEPMMLTPRRNSSQVYSRRTFDSALGISLREAHVHKRQRSAMSSSSSQRGGTTSLNTSLSASLRVNKNDVLASDRDGEDAIIAADVLFLRELANVLQKCMEVHNSCTVRMLCTQCVRLCDSAESIDAESTERAVHSFKQSHLIALLAEADDDEEADEDEDVASEEKVGTSSDKHGIKARAPIGSDVYVACRSDHRVSVRMLAPELCMADCDARLQLMPSMIVPTDDDVGSGAYGRVYGAAWLSDTVGSDVESDVRKATLACKEYFSLDGKAASYSNFVQEVVTMASLPQHRCLVRIYGYWTSPTLTVVMELCAMGTLYEYLHRDEDTDADGSRKHVPYEFAIAVASDIANGLRALHEALPQPLLHRDLKSPNVLLCAVPPVPSNFIGSVAKLADFGTTVRVVEPHIVRQPMHRENSLRAGSGDTLLRVSSRQVHSGGSGSGRAMGSNVQPLEGAGLMDGVTEVEPTVTGRCVDQPVWLAPEIMLGLKYGLPSDVFSLGIVLWELTSREHPWDEFGYGSFMFNQELDCLAGLRPTLGAHVPGQLRDLINSCWTGRPELRPTARACCHMLKAIRKHRSQAWLDVAAASTLASERPLHPFHSNLPQETIDETVASRKTLVGRTAKVPVWAPSFLSEGHENNLYDEDVHCWHLTDADHVVRPCRLTALGLGAVPATQTLRSLLELLTLPDTTALDRTARDILGDAALWGLREILKPKDVLTLLHWCASPLRGATTRALHSQRRWYALYGDEARAHARRFALMWAARWPHDLLDESVKAALYACVGDLPADAMEVSARRAGAEETMPSLEDSWRTSKSSLADSGAAKLASVPNAQLLDELVRLEAIGVARHRLTMLPGSRDEELTPTSSRWLLDAAHQEIAQQLCLVEHAHLRSLNLDELLCERWRPAAAALLVARRRQTLYGGKLEMPVALASVARWLNWTEDMMRWMQTEVLKGAEVQARAKVIRRFVRVARHCADAGNFQTVTEVVQALMSASVVNLSASWDAAGEKTRASFAALSKLVSPTDNYAAYRRSNVRVPILAVLLLDMGLASGGTRSGDAGEDGELRALLSAAEEASALRWRSVAALKGIAGATAGPSSSSVLRSTSPLHTDESIRSDSGGGGGADSSTTTPRAHRHHHHRRSKREASHEGGLRTTSDVHRAASAELRFSREHSATDLRTAVSADLGGGADKSSTETETESESSDEREHGDSNRRPSAGVDACDDDDDEEEETGANACGKDADGDGASLVSGLVKLDSSDAYVAELSMAHSASQSTGLAKVQRRRSRSSHSLSQSPDTLAASASSTGSTRSGRSRSRHSRNNIAADDVALVSALLPPLDSSGGDVDAEPNDRCVADAGEDEETRYRRLLDTTLYTHHLQRLAQLLGTVELQQQHGYDFELDAPLRSHLAGAEVWAPNMIAAVASVRATAERQSSNAGSLSARQHTSLAHSPPLLPLIGDGERTDTTLGGVALDRPEISVEGSEVALSENKAPLLDEARHTLARIVTLSQGAVAAVSPRGENEKEDPTTFRGSLDRLFLLATSGDSVPISFERGDVVRVGGELYYVATGEFQRRLLAPPPDTNAERDLLGPKSLCGTEALFDEEAHYELVVVSDQASLYRIQVSFLRAIIDNQPNLARLFYLHLSSLLAEQLRTGGPQLNRPSLSSHFKTTTEVLAKSSRGVGKGVGEVSDGDTDDAEGGGGGGGGGGFMSGTLGRLFKRKKATADTIVLSAPQNFHKVEVELGGIVSRGDSVGRLFQLSDEEEMAEFRRQLSLGDDVVLANFDCNVVVPVKGVPISRRGTVYVTQHHLCMYAKALGVKVRKVLPLSAVSVQRGSADNADLFVRGDGGQLDKWSLLTVADRNRCAAMVEQLHELIVEPDSTRRRRRAAVGVRGALIPRGADPAGVMDAAEWTLVFQGATWSTFAKGDTIVAKGERQANIFQVQRGECEVRLADADGGEERAVARIGERRIFGEISFLLGGAVSATIVAATDKVEVCVFRHDFLSILFDNNAMLSAKFHAYLCGWLSLTLIERERGSLVSARGARGRERDISSPTHGIDLSATSRRRPSADVGASTRLRRSRLGAKGRLSKTSSGANVNTVAAHDGESRAGRSDSAMDLSKPSLFVSVSERKAGLGGAKKKKKKKKREG